VNAADIASGDGDARDLAVDSLCEIAAPSGSRALAIIGLVKNAGKTTVVNALMATCRRAFGLTSLGLDGEATDHLTGLAKPRIVPPPGTLVATTRGSLERSGYAMEVLEALPFVTPLGQVLIGRAEGVGRVEVSGPTTLAELRLTVERLQAHGAEQVLVDGAVNRLGSASPSVTDGLIMATGGMVADTLAEILDVTAAMLEMLMLPPVSPETRALLRPHLARSVRALSIDAEGRAVSLELPTVIGEGAAVARQADRLGTCTLLIGGAMTEEFVADLIRLLPPRRRLRIVVRDPTVLVLPATTLSRLRKRGIEVEVLTPLKVLALTANPFGLPASCAPDAFFRAVVDAVEGRVPVFDVVHDWAAIPVHGPPDDDRSHHSRRLMP
jgi:hypothetical protein